MEDVSIQRRTLTSQTTFGRASAPSAPDEADGASTPLPAWLTIAGGAVAAAVMGAMLGGALHI